MKIALVHGWFADHSSMESVAQHLKEQGHEVYYIEYKSSLNYFSMRKQVSDQIQPGTDVYIGHSMGGIIGKDIQETANIDVIAINSPFVDTDFQGFVDPSVLSQDFSTERTYYWGDHSMDNFDPSMLDDVLSQYNSNSPNSGFGGGRYFIL